MDHFREDAKMILTGERMKSVWDELIEELKRSPELRYFFFFFGAALVVFAMLIFSCIEF